MHRWIVGFFILAIGFILSAQSAQTIALSGKVKNKSGNPIANAIVRLAGQKYVDTTNAQGDYAINAQVNVIPAPILQNIEKISLINGILWINLIKPAEVGIELFDVNGKVLDRVHSNPTSKGVYRFNLMNHPLAANMMLIRVCIGQRASTFRYLPFNNGNRSVLSPAYLSSTEKMGLAKIQAALDSLITFAPGYFSDDTAISSYQGVVNITLDTMPLENFSFFVTSLAGLQKLSKNDSGFGGDLRFGKTGSGAGLRGADSICQCLAEMSMPGSKIKIWRAFLSAKVGPDGQQVNAIDRIGQGPWYDRLGHVFALSKADFPFNRPKNIDTLIKNDLPNEWGVPNHQPDPNLPAVDNHLTITGSDTIGKLYTGPTSNGGMSSIGFPDTGTDTSNCPDTANSTCEDWTTSSPLSCSKPRCGLSWTRPTMSPGGGGRWPRDTTGGGGGGFTMINMENWMSMWSLPGCKAGMDLSDLTGPGDPKSKKIGAGGGYGGFYCFALNP